MFVLTVAEASQLYMGEVICGDLSVPAQDVVVVVVELLVVVDVVVLEVEVVVDEVVEVTGTK
jgi:hypothetical protein